MRHLRFRSNATLAANVGDTHLAIQAVLAEGGRGQVVVVCQVSGDEQLHFAAGVPQDLGHGIVCYQKRSSRSASQLITPALRR